MNILKKNTTGFTLIEILVTLSIMTILVTLSVSWFTPLIKKEKINREVKVLMSRLEEARSLTLSAKEASQYGVRTETNQIILFKGATYSAGDPENIVHTIDPAVYISIGGGVSTIFTKLSGNVVGITEPRYVILYTVDTSLERTITIHPTGLIEKD